MKKNITGLRRWPMSLLLIFITSCILLRCATNPVTGKKDFMLLSTEQEIQMGKESDPEVMAYFGKYEDADLQQFLSKKGQEMAKISHRPDLPYEFKIVDSPVVNAFAVPGGYVYFTRGIMANFNNEAELAGVLGHEIGHITARHSAKQYSRAQVAQLGLGLGMVFSETVRQYGDLASQSLSLLFLKFGRDAERQSDELGVQYSSEIGYDAHQMADFFQTLDRLGGDEADQVPTFLSTHPDPGEREKTVDKLATKWQKKLDLTDPEVSRNSYLRLIDGIVYGEDPRQGFKEEGRFYHPELKFQFDIPSGWSLQNTPAQVLMSPENGEAVMVLTLAAGNDLKSAADQMLTSFQLEVVKSQQAQVNGFPALAVLASQSDDQGNTVDALFYFIQDGQTIYAMYGASSRQAFSNYRNLFESTMNSFRRLTDQAKLQRQPNHIKIREVSGSMTLESALKRFNSKGERLNELALINGMNLSDQLSKGMLIKTIE